jgi:hypothetical protein
MANPDDPEYDSEFEGYEPPGFDAGSLDDDEFPGAGFEASDFAESLEEAELGLDEEAEAESALFEHPDDLLPGELDMPEEAAATQPSGSRNGPTNGNGHAAEIERRRAVRKASKRSSRQPAGAPAAVMPDAPENQLSAALARSAVQAASASEAALLIAALAPLAIQVAGRPAKALAPVLPVLMQGAAGAARVLYRQPASRPYLRFFPEILAQTVQRLMQALHTGEPLTPEEAADVLAEITGEVIHKRHRRG